jgi:hypothetical protein
MSNSKLISYTLLSPNCNKPRTHKIDKITIHHMAGNLTVEQCGQIFAKSSRQASSNYGIGTDGRVGLYVDEANRSWCSSNAENDHRAITIEVANDKPTDKDNWHVSDKALAKLIELCTDICTRNGIDKLTFTGDKSGNVTLHKMFAATACPGPYLESKIPYVVEEVNKNLSSAESKQTEAAQKTSEEFKSYKVKITCKDGLNVRSSAGVSGKIVDLCRYGYTYTVVGEKVVGSQTWGKLKSGAGWICLTGYTKKV